MIIQTVYSSKEVTETFTNFEGVRVTEIIGYTPCITLAIPDCHPVPVYEDLAISATAGVAISRAYEFSHTKRGIEKIKEAYCKVKGIPYVPPVDKPKSNPKELSTMARQNAAVLKDLLTDLLYT